MTLCYTDDDDAIIIKATGGSYVLAHLGYWVDNGAAYYRYYQSAYAQSNGMEACGKSKNCTREDALLAVQKDATARGIPLRYYQWDDWAPLNWAWPPSVSGHVDCVCISVDLNRVSYTHARVRAHNTTHTHTHTQGWKHTRARAHTRTATGNRRMLTVRGKNRRRQCRHSVFARSSNVRLRAHPKQAGTLRIQHHRKLEPPSLF